MLEVKTYKNYKELCVAMGWHPTTGTAKKAQFKELERLCEYHKEGNKIIIDNIFDIPKEKIDNRGAKGKFQEQVAMSILSVILTNYKVLDNGEIEALYYTKYSLIKKINLANEKLFNRDDDITGISSIEVRSYKNRAIDFCYEALESGLKYLEKKNICLVKNCTFVIYENQKSENLNDTFSTLLLGFEQEVLLELGKSKFLAIKNDTYSDVKNEVIKRYNEFTEDNIIDYSSCIKILCTKKYIDDFRLKVLKKSKLEIDKELWEATNKALISRIENAINKKGENARIAYENYKILKRGKLDFGEEIQQINPIKGFVDIALGFDNYLFNVKILDEMCRKPLNLIH